MPETPLEIQVGDLLRVHNLNLVTAESCTGGLIGHLLTNIPGSSAYYLGGVVAYAYEAKVAMLGVDWDTLHQFGAVSEQIALQMARGARKALHGDIAVSVTGIAGPGGGMPNKPVGLTWVGLSTPTGEWAQHYIWNGNRDENKMSSARAALEMVIRYLKTQALTL